MFEYIKGSLVSKNPAYVVIDVGGLAYRINISLNTFEQIENQKEVKLLVHLSIKEDAHTLFGFYKEEERNMFRNLISVSGIGSSTALLMLSSLTVNEIISAIINANVSLLKSVKGIGAKTAQRLIVELQSSLSKSSSDDVAFLSKQDPSFEEAVGALTMLGFKKNEAEKVVNKIVKGSNEKLNVEEIIKLALKSL